MNQILDVILTFSHLIHVRLEVSKYNLIANFNMKTNKSHTIHESNQPNHGGHVSSKAPRFLPCITSQFNSIIL